MSSVIDVIVKYKPIAKLANNQIELNGEIAGCDQCPGWGKCCNTGDRCRKCSCQNIVDCGVTGLCAIQFGCKPDMYYNKPIFQEDSVPDNFPCVDALKFTTGDNIIYNTQNRPIGKVVNIDAIKTQCNSRGRLDCCKGKGTASMCGPWWGPGHKGQCDSLMQSYCDTYPHDKLCACFTSEIPQSQCADKRCANTNAMKTAKMLVPCSGNIMNCLQYFQIAEGALENVINNNEIKQNCEQQINEEDRPEREADRAASPQTISNMVFIIGGSVVGLFVLIIAGLLLFFFLYWRKRKNKPSSEGSPKDPKTKRKQSLTKEEKEEIKRLNRKQKDDKQKQKEDIKKAKEDLKKKKKEEAAKRKEDSRKTKEQKSKT